MSLPLSWAVPMFVTHPVPFAFREEACVLVHGAEGTDTTLLVTALAQVILDPDCRTLVGFQHLLEREWIQVNQLLSQGPVPEGEGRGGDTAPEQPGCGERGRHLTPGTGWQPTRPAPPQS